ncbi:unnamed protein product, partial [Hapterophycus canaliculatus]
SVWRNLGTALVLAGRPNEAILDLERSLHEFSVDAGMNNTANCSVEGSGGDSTLGNWKVASCEPGDAATTATTAATRARKKSKAFLLDSLSAARSAAGDVDGAIATGQKALSLVDDEPGLYHNMAVLLQKSGLLVEARDAWLSAAALDPNFSPAFTGLGHLEGAWGNVERARKFFEESLTALRSKKKGNTGGYNGPRHSHIGGRDAELVSMFLIATAVIPALYESTDHVAQVRRDFESGLERLLAEPIDVTSPGVEDPSTTVGSGALGYFIIYQGFEDVEIRRKLARAYWKFAPSLRYCAPFLERDNGTWIGDHQSGKSDDRASGRQHHPSPAVEGPHSRQSRFPGKSIEWLESTPTEGMTASTAVLALEITKRPPTPTTEKNYVVRGAPPEPRGEQDSDHQRSKDHGNEDNEDAPSAKPCRRGRIRVGFLSAFFYHHSVGLLTEGVVTRLDRRRFETTAIFLQPHPTSAMNISASSTDTSTGGARSRESSGDGR